jgi:hypothetical protein
MSAPTYVHGVNVTRLRLALQTNGMCHDLGDEELFTSMPQLVNLLTAEVMRVEHNKPPAEAPS